MKKLLSLGIVSLVALSTLSPLVSAASTEGMRMMGSGATGSGRTVDLTCVRTAVSTRETAVRAAYSTLSTSYLAGLDTRAMALDAAWMMTDKTARKTAREAAWSAWNTTAKTARETFRKARKASWDAYRMSAKACRAPSSELESTMVQNQDVQ